MTTSSKQWTNKKLQPLMSFRSFCSIWHHRSFHSSSSPIFMDWFQRKSSLMAQILLVISKLPCLSDQLTLHQRVSQGSVPDLLQFILYTTLLGSLISDSSVSHYLYICLWSSTFNFLCRFWLLCQDASSTGYNYCSCLNLDIFESSISQSK